MKKFVSLILLFAILFSSVSGIASAQTPSSFKTDELAYIAYSQANNAFWGGIVYLETLKGLMKSFGDSRTWNDISHGAFNAYFLAEMDMTESIQRFMLINQIGEHKFGIDNIASNGIKMNELIEAIKEEANLTEQTDPRSAIFILLSWAQEADYLKKEETFQSELETAAEAIRLIESEDKDFSFLNTLNEYLNEASAVHDYLVNVSYDYDDLLKVLENYQRIYNNREYTFDYIFGSDAYKTYGDAYARFLEERKISEE